LLRARVVERGCGQNKSPASARGLLHLLRIVLGWEAVVGGWSIPMWFSWVAMIVTVVLAYHGFTNA
jgi:hypothetical protein